ncbi:Polyribonucleotide nucleotidyltransferase [bacterium HR34]|nr:Polyribonucleotide nucleotidyltransferase [bacterium HR34]
MENNKTFELQLGNKTIKINRFGIAKKANGSCTVQLGDTVILATATMDKNPTILDFFPLTVDYEERYYAAGKILGSRFIRRETRPTEEAILTARLIDRSIRPCFPKEFKNPTQVIITTLSWDKENDPDILGIIGASISLGISDIPFNGPVASLRIAKKKEEFIVNPTYEEREEAELDIVLSAVKSNKTKDDFVINMIEAEAKEVPEKKILEAVEYAKDFLRKMFEFQENIIKELGKEKLQIKKEEKKEELEKLLRESLKEKIEKEMFSGIEEHTPDIENELNEILKRIQATEEDKKYAYNYIKEIKREILHEKVLEEGKRPDGRKINEIRPISFEIDVLPRTHGSAIFNRGKTRSLSILTLGAPGEQKVIESMEFIGKKRFMHHYNFPPYCSGEVSPLKGPSRREIGHGMLVERALFPVIPEFANFPYTIRIVTEILSSNGSTSMASTCSSSAALMAAGVPIKRPVAGIAIGLIVDENNYDNYKLLADIQGPEDHEGDMDFKVAGTEKGITAIQLDTKIEGITYNIIKDALNLAKECREKILQEMKKTIAEPRKELSKYAPRVLNIKIPEEKIREVIGPGGKVINEIIDKFNVIIDIEEDGSIFVTGEEENSARKALEWIRNITREIKVGEIFEGKVVKIYPFGAIVEILPGQVGMVHISELAPFRVNKVEDIVKIGEIIPVKVVGIDELGRINLSRKQVIQKNNN